MGLTSQSYIPKRSAPPGGRVFYAIPVSVVQGSGCRRVDVGTVIGKLPLPENISLMTSAIPMDRKTPVRNPDRASRRNRRRRHRDRPVGYGLLC